MIVAVVLLVSLAQFSIHNLVDASEVTDPDPLGVLLILVTVLPLLVRRRYPWVSLVMAGAGNIALVACGYPVHIPAALIVALYTFAADSRRAIWPPALVAALLFGVQIAVEEVVLSLSLEDYILPPLLLAGSWILGERHQTAAASRAEAAERREKEQQLAIAEERTRIARELHDSAGHAINTILVQAGAARVTREREPEKSLVSIEAIERLARETIEDIDRIVGSLRADEPAELAPLPGFDRIVDLVASQREAGLEIELIESGENERKPPLAVGRAAYRICQECLTNAARHGSGRLNLTIGRFSDRLEITAVNPVGSLHSMTRRGGGLGLIGMGERAQILGGRLESGPVAEGFRVHAVLPYDWSRS